jgi:hypothetical protein
MISKSLLYTHQSSKIDFFHHDERVNAVTSHSANFVRCWRGICFDQSYKHGRAK